MSKGSYRKPVVSKKPDYKFGKPAKSAQSMPYAKAAMPKKKKVKGSGNRK